MPPENNPRLVFERLFGAEDLSPDPQIRARRAEYRKSILDMVRDDTQKLIGNLGSSDRRKIDEYLYAIREIEKRIERFGLSIVPGRDFAFERADVRTVEAGDLAPGGHPITIEPAIEVGNIFKLGTRYSEPFEATYLDENGREQLIWMGSYGIGPARIAAAAVEQYADDHGISWPRSLAPFDVHLVGLGRPDSPERELAEDVYATLLEAGVAVLYDDRDAGPGEKFADAELLGCPLRLTIGKRSVESGSIEVQRRRGREDAEPVPIEPRSAIPERVRELLQELP